MNARKTLFWTLLAAVLPAAASAGTVITMQEDSGRGAFTSKLELQNGNLRIETQLGGQSHVMLYRSDAGSLWMLDDANKTYMELAGGAGGNAPAASDMATQMIMERKDLSEEQKKQILANMQSHMARAPMGGRGAGAPAAPLTYRKVASGVSVNGFTTDQYEVLQEDQKIRDLWVAPPQALRIDAADFTALEAMGKSLAQRSPSGRSGGPLAFARGDGAPEGVPVRVVNYQNGNKTFSTDVTAVSHEDVPASRFELPPGYRKVRPGMPRD